MKLHLDTDLGGDIDDLCALAMLLRWPDLEITGITTCAEENGRRAGYTHYALGLAGRTDIPLAAGGDVSLGGYRYHPGYPDEERYWPEAIPAAPGPHEAALELLKNSIDQGALIVGIGPFTNFALLERRYPGILERANLFLMGGYIYPPRPGYPAWGNDMDYNIQVDVNSALFVLEHSRPTLVTLAVTVETVLRRAYLEPLRQSGPLGTLIVRQAEAFAQDWKNETAYGETCLGLPRDTINFQYDPMACAIALGWNDGVLVQEIPLSFRVVGGWLLEQIDSRGKPTRVLTKANGMAFSEFWLKTVTG